VSLVVGLFSDTLPEFVRTHDGPCSFLHVDCDLYSSAKTVFEDLGDRIQPGTVIVFDEFFNYPGWQNGEYRAFCDFVAARNLKFQYIGYTERDEQVAIRFLTDP
jgi:predicted O-methyltransferase YrrM